MGLFCISIVTADGEMASLEDSDTPGVTLGFATLEEAKDACKRTVEFLGNQWMEVNGKNTMEVRWNEEGTSALLEDNSTVSVADFTGVAKEITIQ